ncbi:MAG: hypothetical protein QOE02_5446, partial [Rhodospirillaceae bacterium]|nr:hypothetical protein [Rhodospirillaceae bacterium]
MSEETSEATTRIRDFALDFAAVESVPPIAIELSGLDIAVILRSLASIEHSVVAHDSHAAYACVLRHFGPLLELLGGPMVVPRHEE